MLHLQSPSILCLPSSRARAWAIAGVVSAKSLRASTRPRVCTGALQPPSCRIGATDSIRFHARGFSGATAAKAEIALVCARSVGTKGVPELVGGPLQLDARRGHS